MSELNPNHPVTQTLHEHWHKLAALLVHKQGGHVVITSKDIQSLPQGLFITVEEKSDGLHLQMVDEATAQRLAHQHGGLPS